MARKPSRDKQSWRSRIVGHGQLKASEILKNPWNHRTHPDNQKRVVSASIDELGFVKSVLVNRTTGNLIDGHERVWQAESRDPNTMIDVEYVELTEDEERKALLLLDSSSELAGIDAGALESLAGVCQFDHIALASHAESMMAAAGLFKQAAAQDDDIPEEIASRAKPGDLWRLGPHRVLCGDAENADDVSRLLAGAVPRVMVTDPPYGVNYDPKWRERVKDHVSGDSLGLKNDHKASWIDAYVLFPGDIAYVWHSALYSGEFYNELNKAGFEIRGQIIWVKPKTIVSRGAYHWQHEGAIMASRGDLSMEPMEEKEAELGWYAVRRGAVALWSGGRKRSTVWEVDYKGEDTTRHGTQKPVDCMARAMQNHGAPGDAVYDPFLGSGTSVIAAYRTNRVCYGLEIDPFYVDTIIARWENLTGVPAVLESEKPQE